MSNIITVASSSMKSALRDRSVLWLGILFMSMVLLSAYLGWSATHTINQIYAQATLLFQAEGRTIPPNPVDSMSALAILRNLTTYVSLLGALVAMVLGGQMIGEDRRSGCYPLIASRPVRRQSYALGKLVALGLALGGLLLLSAGVNILMVLWLPGDQFTLADWSTLFQFYVLSWLFLLAWGMLGMASAAGFRSESMGILLPVAVWLMLTFVFPQLSANINPMAAMNPVKAMVAPPGGSFFDVVGTVLAPFSLTSNYRDMASALLGVASVDTAFVGMRWGMFSLIASDLLLLFSAGVAIVRLNPTRSDYDA